MGQWLSLPMVIAGVALWFYFGRDKSGSAGPARA